MGFPGIWGLTIAQYSKQSTCKLGFHTLQVYESYLSQDAFATQTPCLRIPHKNGFQTGKQREFFIRQREAMIRFRK